MSKKLDLKKINEVLPDNICVLTFSIGDFGILLPKLNSYWYQISIPEQKEDENIKWVIATAQYKIKRKVYYILYCFGNVKEADIREEIEGLKVNVEN